MQSKKAIYSQRLTQSLIFDSSFQIIVLLVFKNFLLYLLTASVIGALQKIGVSLYLRKMYPYLLENQYEN